MRDANLTFGSFTDIADGCQNCGTRHDWYLLHEYQTDDGRTLNLCHDCCTEFARIEKLAIELAEMPSCEARQSIIDRAETTEILVNGLSAHDLRCACASTVCCGEAA
jgi:hypothetical protein